MQYINKFHIISFHIIFYGGGVSPPSWKNIKSFIFYNLYIYDYEEEGGGGGEKGGTKRKRNKHKHKYKQVYVLWINCK
jgi:hypothetical protein